MKSYLPAVLIGIAAVGALLFGIFGQKAEPTLVRVCDDGAATVRYSPPAKCDSKELVWPRSQVPLSVLSTKRAVRDAVAEVDRQLGFEVLRSVQEGPADVIVTLNVPHEAGWRDALGTTSHTRGDRMRADVQIGNAGDVATLHAALVHELGHVLGLAHDDYEGSIMYRSVTGQVRFSDADRKVLRRLYR